MAQNDFLQKSRSDDPKSLTFGYDYGLNGISSFPLGDFAKTTQSTLPKKGLIGPDTNKLNGYAKKGFHYDVYVTYKIKKDLNFIFAIYGDQNNYNADALNTQFLQYYPSATSAVTTGSNYYIVQYVAGPYLDIPLPANFGIEIKAMAGYTTANYPGLFYITLPGTEIYTIQKGSGFGYTFGTGMKYTLPDLDGPVGLGFHININYSASNITYPGYNVTTYDAAGNYVAGYTYHVPKTMAVSILQVTFGVSVELF